MAETSDLGLSVAATAPASPAASARSGAAPNPARTATPSSLAGASAASSPPDERGAATELLFPTGVRADELPDCAQLPPVRKRQFTVTGHVREVRVRRTAPIGRRVRVNERDVLLLRHRDRVVAVGASCPHQAGDLSLGDLEELPGGSLCVTCPVHAWRFDATPSAPPEWRGRCLSHPHAEAVLDLVPATVDPDSGLVSVGFKSMARELFAAPDF